MAEANDRPYHHGQLREALLEAAEETLRHDGADQLSLREVARIVGVSHAAPRRHFPDRQALLDALAVAGFVRLDAQLRAAIAGAGADFGSRLGAAVTAYLRFATEDAALLELMFTGKHRPGAEQVVEAAAPAFTALHDLILEGQAAGELAPGEPDEVGIVLFATIHGIATLRNGDLVRQELLENLADRAVEQFVRGARPR